MEINEQTATDYEQVYYEAVELLQEENISETDRVLKHKQIWMVYGPYVKFKQRSRELNTPTVIEVPMKEVVETKSDVELTTVGKLINEIAEEF